MTGKKAVIIVGNPRTPSRSMVLAREVRCNLTKEGVEPPLLIDLSQVELGSAVLSGTMSRDVQIAVNAVIDSNIVAVISPTYKASITGLLKSFLDLLPHRCLEGRVALPLMVGSSPGHQLAVELTMRPVLSELGAVCPANGLFVLDTDFSTDTQQLSAEASAKIKSICQEAIALAQAISEK